MIGESLMVHWRIVSLKTTRGIRRCKPSHLRKHDVRATTGREVIQPLEGLGTEPVVMVGEEDVVASAASRPTLRGCPGQPEFGWWITRNVRVRRCKLIKAFRSVICGAVVDADDLEFVLRKAL